MAENVYDLAVEVQKLRKAQRQYFLQRGKASRTGNADDRKLAANTLALCKHLEQLMDDKVSKIVEGR